MADITLLDLKNAVRQELLAYTELQTVSMAADGRDAYYIGDSPIIEGSLRVWVDDIESLNTTGMTDVWQIDLNTGLFLWQPGMEPDPEASLLWRFYVEPWSESMLTDSINSGILDCKDTFSEVAMDTTSVVGDGITQEYALPAACWYLRDVWTSLDGTSWDREYDWVTFDGNGGRYIRFIGGVPLSFVRVRYDMTVNTLVEDTDTLEPNFGTQAIAPLVEPTHANLQNAARDAIVMYACWRLVDQSLLPRARNNVFLNAEGSNAVRTIDLIRTADRYAQRYQMAMQRSNKRPKFWRGS